MAIATQATVTGSGTSVNSISASSWTPGANELILVWVACRLGVTVSSVAGNGITFTKVAEDLQSPQNQCTLSLWRGMSAAPSTGQITATLSGTAAAAIMVAHRINGVDTSGSNGSGAIGASAIANTGASDTDTPSVDLTTTAANSRIYGGATHRSRTYSVGTGETSISINNSVGTAGDSTSLSTEYQDVASSGSTVTINGTLNSALDWIQGAVEVKAASTAITGDLSVTQAGDTLSATGAVALQAAATPTQAGDTLSATGAVALQAAATPTQAGDTLSAAGALDIQAVATPTQAGDTLSAAGAVALQAAATPTQAGDTLSSAGAVALQAVATPTQAGDTLSATGAVAIVGDLSVTQAGDTLSAQGGATVITGDLSVTQAGDTLSATGAVALQAAATPTQAGDTLSAAGAVALQAAATPTQAGDTLSSAGALAIVGNLSATQTGDTLSAASTIADIPGVGGTTYFVLRRPTTFSILADHSYSVPVRRQSFEAHTMAVVEVEKDPDETIDVTLDYTALLNGATISSSSWSLASGITSPSSSNTTTATTLRVTGGTLGQKYKAKNTIEATSGQIFVRRVVFMLMEL